MVGPTNGKIVLHDKLRLQTMFQVSHCLVSAEWLSQCGHSTADFLTVLNFHPLSG